MLTKIIIKNFKKLDSIEIDLDSVVVFVGPNNSGKTTALQAISLWELGMRKWAEKRLNYSKSKQTKSVAINRKDILSTPVISARQLWQDLCIYEGQVAKPNGKKVNIEIIAEGFTEGKRWQLGFEFAYANEESIYCRILQDEHNSPLEFPIEALAEHIGFLHPMSGLASEEYRLEKGSINVRIGEGRTAEVLRNLCWIIYEEKKDKWNELVEFMYKSFKIRIAAPVYDSARGSISITYKELNKKKMDLLNVGRGFQQILLLLSYIYANKNTILLLDEPDAHLEIVRQREIYNLLSEIVRKEKSQLIIATHSIAILNEAAERDKIIAFLGKPHIMNEKKYMVKSLSEIGYDQYLLAEQKKWVLYLEGSTDLSMLKAFSEVLNHPVRPYLDNIFIKYISNNRPQDARNHFYALQKEAIPTLKGIAIFDKLNKNLDIKGTLKEMMWRRCEIENYLPIPEVIIRYIEKVHNDNPSFKYDISLKIC